MLLGVQSERMVVVVVAVGQWCDVHSVHSDHMFAVMRHVLSVLTSHIALITYSCIVLIKKLKKYLISSLVLVIKGKNVEKSCREKTYFTSFVWARTSYIAFFSFSVNIHV